MEQVKASRLITRTYADGWSHLDEDKHVANVKLTPRKMTVESTGYDEGNTYVQYARVPRGVDNMELAQALRDTMGGSSCRHEYDCCGCATAHVSVKVVANRRLLVRTRISYNY